MLTQIDQRTTLRQRITRQIRRRTRTHDLTTVRNRHQPRRAIHRRTEVVAVTQFRAAGVQTDARPQRFAQRPVLVAERAPRRDRGADRVVSGRERRVDAVAPALDQVSVERRDD